MAIIVEAKKLARKDEELMRRGMKKLEAMILQRENSGVRFEKIFNDDVIKYDVFKKNFYTFKFRGEDSSQLRILYRFVRNEDDSFNLECHLVEVKRRSGKEYIQKFEKYVANF